MKIKPEILEILSNGRVEGDRYFLPPGQLDRAVYMAVNKCLDSCNFKWNKKLKCHVSSDEDLEEKFENMILTGEFTDKKRELNFFPTPPEIVKQMIELAKIKGDSKCLEPSFGRGAIIEELIKLTGFIEGVEIDKDNFDFVTTKYDFKGFNDDFLDLEMFSNYDRIIMNPPFRAKGLPQADISHILHAFSFLRSGGILVSVVSESPFFRTNKKSLDFIRWLKENNGESIKLSEGAFSSSGTNVRTRIIKVIKL